MLVVALGCIALFYFELTDISFLKLKRHFFWINTIINRQACSAIDCLEQSYRAA